MFKRLLQLVIPLKTKKIQQPIQVKLPEIKLPEINIIYKRLFNLQVGFYKIETFTRGIQLSSTERLGWVEVAKDNDSTIAITWKTNKNFHFPHGPFGPALCITIKSNGELQAYFESRLSMWIMWGHGMNDPKELIKAQNYAKWLYTHLCHTPNTSVDR